jgi:hypothetical protein
MDFVRIFYEKFVFAFIRTRSGGYATDLDGETEIAASRPTEDFSARPPQLALLHPALPEAAI